MKKLFLLLILSFFSTQGFTASCPDGSEPTRSVSADGTYFVYTCGGQSSSSSSTSTSNNIPPNAHASGSGWKCNSGYRKNASFCELDVPDNAYPVGNTGRWTCKYGYSRSGMSCTKTYVPENAYLSSNTGWTCYPRYERSGNSCVEKTSSSKKIPPNARDPSSSWVVTPWICNPGYYKTGNTCTKLPPNARASGSSWVCLNPYVRSGNSCVKKSSSSLKIPANAYAVGNFWKCKSGYRKSGNSCIKSSSINIPANAYAYGSSWKCYSGYQKSGNRCIEKINIPANAYAYGSSWKCNSGYQKSGNSCIEDDKIYPAGSGTGFAATSDGHIVTNQHVINGCTQVTIHNQGKSFIATIITQDSKNDLAILKSDLKPSKIYPLSTDLFLSDVIFSAGYPFGKRISSAVTINKGIVSALMGPDDDISIFQIDAGLNPGNSGGPIVDRMGNSLGVAVGKIDEDYALEEYGLDIDPQLFNFAINSMMVIGLFRSQGIELPEKNITELSVQERSKLFNGGTFYLSCGMTIAQYEKMEKTNKVMFTREVVFSDLELD